MSYNFKIFNNRILYLIPVVFLIVILLRITYSYYNIKEQEYNFAKNKAEVLRTYAMVYREYYQKMFVKKIVKLNDDTLNLLPAFSSKPISDRFSQENYFKISVKTVSDKARNFANQSDKSEMKAIEYFKQNKDKKEYFTDENKEFYQYGYVLRVGNVCLKCHGKKENAPKYVQKRYHNAYNYKLGDVRGIMSIKIPKKVMSEYFGKLFLHSIIYDIGLLLFLSFFIVYLLKRSRIINVELEKEVIEKTSELKESLITDRLTGLPNRHKLIEQIKSNINSPKKYLALINISRFKDINDFYGHSVADLILLELTKKFSSFCDKKDFELYKLPSDEFAIFTTLDIEEREFYESIKNIIEHINETKIKTPKGVSMFLTLSCGISSNSTSLLVRADIALQNAKKSSKHVVLYNDEMDISNNITNNITALHLLQDAIKNDLIKPYFQPIYSVKTQNVDKYEALIRIVKEDGDVILPYQFLDIAKRSKLYFKLTQIMIERTFKYFEDKDYEFSINLSIEDITNKQTVDFIIEKVSSFKAPQRVVFEILETEKINNYAQIEAFINKLRPYNCKIAIDDFGSGYSNFAHILELQIDYIKIDSSLVKNVLTNQNSQKVIQTIIDFGKNLSLEIVAEYVEDKESLELLQKMGIDYIQGYYIGKPTEDII